jgi:hypothetical protein
MSSPRTHGIPFQEIENGALILLLLRECGTWEELCARYLYAQPADLNSTTTMMLRDKLVRLREAGLIEFQGVETANGEWPAGKITATDLWTRVRVALGGMSASDAALLSRHSSGMAVVPVFGRPEPVPPIDVFVLMPFDTGMEGFYRDHIRGLGDELGITIRRADDTVSDKPFMLKVWNGICSARLVLADCTQNNPNVFYEIGIAHTVGKKVVLITRSENDIPADVKHFDYIPYIYDPAGTVQLIAKLRTFLTAELGLQAPPGAAR